MPATTTAYSLTTGLATSLTSTAGTITTGYDGWGRETTYTPSGQTATTTTYDNLDRVLTVTDPKGSTTFGYGPDANGKVERRGMATSITHTTSGRTLTFAGAYDAAGNLVVQTMPGGLTQTTSYDTAGEPVGLTYTGPDDQPWMAWTQANDTQGRVVADLTPDLSGTPGPGATGADQYRHAYSYNGLGQLTSVVDTTLDPANPDTSLGCTRRDYTFTANGARAGQTTRQAGTGSDCTTGTTTTSTRAWTLDTADRITTSSNTTAGGTATGNYTYDALGRVTTLPAVDTPTGGNTALTYRADDSVDTITSDGTTQTYTYDTMGRRLAATSTGTTPKTLTRAYADTSDNPAWTVETRPVTGGNQTTTTRYLGGLGNGLAATTDTTEPPLSGPTTTSTLTLANLHGDIVTTSQLPATGDATGIDTWQATDEYGNPLTGTTPGATPAAYNWHGTAERSTDTPARLILMGARLYNTITGHFTSPDPEYGGNDTTYTHPTDPINGADLDGHKITLKKVGKFLWKHKTAIALAAVGFVPGLGAAVWAYRAYRAVRVVQTTLHAAKGASRIAKVVAKARHFVRDGNPVLRIGRSQGVGEFHVSFGNTRKHWLKSSGAKRQATRLHGHFSRRYGGIDFHTTKKSYNVGLWKK